MQKIENNCKKSLPTILNNCIKKLIHNLWYNQKLNPSLKEITT